MINRNTRIRQFLIVSLVIVTSPLIAFGLSAQPAESAHPVTEWEVTRIKGGQFGGAHVYSSQYVYAESKKRQYWMRSPDGLPPSVTFSCYEGEDFVVDIRWTSKTLPSELSGIDSYLKKNLGNNLRVPNGVTGVGFINFNVQGSFKREYRIDYVQIKSTGPNSFLLMAIKTDHAALEMVRTWLKGPYVDFDFMDDEGVDVRLKIDVRGARKAVEQVSRACGMQFD